MTNRMEYEMDSWRAHRYVYENISDFEQANYSPIHGYENTQILSLEEAVQPVLSFLNNNLTYVSIAKEKCKRHPTDLTWDQSAAIYLYTMPTPLFTHLNKFLRDKNRHALKVWFPFLKLLISAFQKLPSSHVAVWRGVSGDAGSFFIDQWITWWAISSTSKDLDVVEKYIGDIGTLFHIQARDGKVISDYSSIKDDNEVILLPGIRLHVICQPFNYHDQLQIVDLEQEDPPEDTLRDVPDIYYDTIPDSESASLIHEHPPEISYRQTHRAKRCCTNRNTLVSITVGIGLLIVAIMSLFFLNKKSQATSLFTNEGSPNWTGQTTLASSGDVQWSVSPVTTLNGLIQINSTFCFPVGWSSSAEIRASGGTYSALAVDDHFNVYVVNQRRKSLEKWSPDGRLVKDILVNNFDTKSPLFFHSPSQSLYFGYSWNFQSNLFKLHIDSSRPILVLNDTTLEFNYFKLGEDCSGLYVNLVGEIFILFKGSGHVLKYAADSTSGILIAEGHKDNSNMSRYRGIISSAIDERNDAIYMLDRDGSSILKYFNGSLIGTLIVDLSLTEIFYSVKRERFDPWTIVVDRTGYFLLGESDRISIWTPDAKFNSTVVGEYHTDGDEKEQVILAKALTFDRLGNLYAVDDKLGRVLKFNRTSLTCAD